MSNVRASDTRVSNRRRCNVSLRSGWIQIGIARHVVGQARIYHIPCLVKAEP